MNAKETIGEFNPDMLIYDGKFPVDTKTVSVKSGQGVIPRGGVIAVSASGCVLWNGNASGDANSIMCDDVDTGTTGGSTVLAQVYRSGHFARQSLKLGASVTELTDTAEKQLQDAGIYLSNAILAV